MTHLERIAVGVALGLLFQTSYGAPALPTIPGGVYNILNYGAVGDGVTTNTAAIQAAINAAAGSAARGGTVFVPAGTFLSGFLTLSNNINLQLDASATLKMLPYGSFPDSAPAFIYANKLHDIEISGSGTIDGQGAVWW